MSIWAVFSWLRKTHQEPCKTPDKGKTLGRCSNAACMPCNARWLIREAARMEARHGQ